MPDETPTQPTIAKLLETAQRCRRLAGGITDRATHERMLEMAKECEAKAEELREQTWVRLAEPPHQLPFAVQDRRMAIVATAPMTSHIDNKSQKSNLFARRCCSSS